MRRHWDPLCNLGTLRDPSNRNDYALIMKPSEIEPLIAAGFADAVITVNSDDNTHFTAHVVAAEFEGKRPLARHQLVYKTLGDLVGGEIHALSITALTPAEWRKQSGGD